MGRGRPAVLKDRKTTSVSLESWHDDYVKTHNIDLSKFVRDNLDALIKSQKSPIEQLKRENEDIDCKIQDLLIIKRKNEEKIKELEEEQVKKQEEAILQNQFEAVKRQYVIESERMLQVIPTCTKDWLEYMLETCKFTTFDEAKSYIREIWLEDGVPEKRIKTFLKLN